MEADSPDHADLQQLLLSCARAAEELKDAYLDQMEPGTNPPPYLTLIFGDKKLGF